MGHERDFEHELNICKEHRYKEEDKVRLEAFRIECQQAVKSAKQCYFTNLGNRVNDPNTSQRSYWKNYQWNNNVYSYLNVNYLMTKILSSTTYTVNVNNLITKNKSGFRPGDSTTTDLLYLVNEIHEAFEDPKSLKVRAVFLDISKACDKVWHEGLVFKLKQNGISGKLLKFLESYLCNRKQRVVLKGYYSDYSNIESGVPQGSVLGPLLFLIYINDLERNIKSNIKFFADDSMLFSIVNNHVISATDLNHDLDIIYQWVHQWTMEFNPGTSKKANEVLFSCQKANPPGFNV